MKPQLVTTWVMMSLLTVVPCHASLMKSIGPEILCEFALVSRDSGTANSPIYESVMSKLFKDLKDIKKHKFELMMKLNASLLHRHLAQPSIPLIADETESAIREFSSQESRLSESYDLAFQKVKAAVLRDPYFTWLKENAADNRVVVQDSNSFTIDRSGGAPLRASEVPKEPIRLLFYNTLISGPSYLPLELSKVLVFRDLDPELSAEQISWANDILNLNKLEFVFRNNLIDQLRNGWLMKEAWSLAPTIASAKVILEKVHSSLRAKVTHEFPENAYQKTLDWMENTPPNDAEVMRELYRLTLGGVKLTPQKESELRSKIGKICKRLGIGESFDPLKMKEVFRYIGLQKIRQDPSYGHFLILYYGNSELDTFALNLKSIIEIMGVIDQPEALFLVVRRLLANGNFRY